MKKIPLRRCLGCYESKPKNELYRVGMEELSMQTVLSSYGSTPTSPISLAYKITSTSDDIEKLIIE
jgi:hypothetical protein